MALRARSVQLVLVRGLSASRAAAAAKKSTGTQTTSSNKLSTGNKDARGYYGRSVEYTDNHTQSLHTYYDLEIAMRSHRLPQPEPKRS
eukprot:m.296996 g.296996  ORF g.296996 m.296996 type:complete len:88 (-) comp13499_c0_seq1:97-360(-)